jgi:hypothetical protein
MARDVSMVHLADERTALAFSTVRGTGESDERKDVAKLAPGDFRRNAILEPSGIASAS